MGRRGESARPVLRAIFVDDAARSIARITFEPIKAGDTLEDARDGVTYGPTLPPVAWTRVTFAPPPSRPSGTAVESAGYLVGVKDGSHRIATAAPKPR